MQPLMQAARGEALADLVLKNCQYINVFTETIETGDIGISNGIILGVGAYEGKQEWDMGGKMVCPGLIDGHVHIESSMLTPSRFGQVVLPYGVTTVIADPHEIANVAGLNGIDFMIQDAQKTLLDIYFMMPSCVPSTEFEHAGAILNATDMQDYFEQGKVLGLGEMMNYPGVIYGNTEVHDKLDIAKGLVIDGHGPGLKGMPLNAYISAGIQSDHECTTVEEMHEKLAKGMFILIREGSATKNLDTLIRGVNSRNHHRVGFCTDDKHPSDLSKKGSINEHIQKAIGAGIDPILAVKMATYNTAQFYRLYDRGAIAPGMLADLVILNRLDTFDIFKVLKSGIPVQNGLISDKEVVGSERLRQSVNILDSDKIDLTIPLHSDIVHVIQMVEHNIVTKDVLRKVDIENGTFKYNHKLDLLKIAVIERHHQTGNVGLGLVEGFGLREGAIALSIAHDSHNVIVIGSNDTDMKLAIDTIEEMQGGIVLVHHGKIVGTVLLEIGGLMTDRPISEIIDELSQLEWEARKLGVHPKLDPFLSLAFLALPVIPDLKMTDQGLFDVKQFKFIELEA